MDNATEAQRRIEARAVGRTPEEHAALERALERRRRRNRLSHASSPAISRPVQQHQHHHHHPSQQGNEDDGHVRFQPLGANGFEGRAEDDREASSPAEVLEYLHEVDDSEIYRIFRIIHAGVESPSWVSESSFYFDYAMFRAKVAAAKSGPTLPALGIPPGRKSKPAHTMRNVRGAGWHRRGYRDLGMMWINVREGSYGHTRGMDASENESLTSFVRSVFSSRATRYPEGWYCDLFFKKKSVTRLLVDLENHGLDMDLVLVKDYFDGGETVYFKLFDEDGEQQSHAPFG
ncbi:hypothetical protein F5Y07DRAFT_280835 [Xylaria sp. FL0933]|nr:hypothetical protein F5Y07DRAFT_280835 [Xylaria sp. FL0933]